MTQTRRRGAGRAGPGEGEREEGGWEKGGCVEDEKKRGNKPKNLDEGEKKIMRRGITCSLLLALQERLFKLHVGIWRCKFTAGLKPFQLSVAAKFYDANGPL